MLWYQGSHSGDGDEEEDGTEGDEVRPTQEPELSSSGDDGGQEEKGGGDDKTTEERDAAAGIGGVEAAAVETPGGWRGQEHR